MVPFLRMEEELKIVTQERHWDRPELSYSFWSSLIQPIEEQLSERARKSHVENSGDRTCMKFKKRAREVLHCSGRTPCTRRGWKLTITKRKKQQKGPGAPGKHHVECKPATCTCSNKGNGILGSIRKSITRLMEVILAPYSALVRWHLQCCVHGTGETWM